ncbi:uncharacterized protein [Apostichopus japonicus]|uniref:uncharacterized protein isoform X2 n=1 Tax=Stichopus japonicus TaxID=307972 RepID=UPI003AB5297B
MYRLEKWKSCVTIIYLLLLQQGICSITTWIPRGESITINCTIEVEVDRLPLWKFNDEVIYADGFEPKGLGFSNVRGKIVDNITSYLYIEDFTIENAGTYTCFINDSIKQYFLRTCEMPELNIAVNGKPMNVVYYVKEGDDLSVVCMAANSTCASLQLTFDDFESIRHFSIKNQNHRQSVTDNDVLRANFTAWKDVNVTCHLNYGQTLDFKNVSFAVLVSSQNELNGNSETVPFIVVDFTDPLFITVVGAVAVTIVITFLLIVICIRTRKKEKPQEMTYMSENENTNGDQNMDINLADPELVSEVPSNRKMSEQISVSEGLNELVSEVPEMDFSNSDGTAGNAELSTDNVQLVSLLSTGTIFDYWKASSKTSTAHEYFIAKTVSDKAQMKDGYNFIFMASKIRQLNDNPNIVTFLGCAIEKAPYYIYQELLEDGTLREILMRIGNSQHHLQNPSNGKEELTNAACLVGFARDVASGLEFLHINKLCHPGLMTRKILYDSNNKCKLFDFWPNEISSDRLKKILTRKDPPIGWFPPETIFMNQYDEVSDIWSYGVILWEIFSFGEEPYQHESVKDVEENIRQLNFLPRPMSCPGSIFSIMLSAWTQTRETRPSISELKTKIDDISAEYLPTDMAPPSTDYFSISDPNAEYAVPWANI